PRRRALSNSTRSYRRTRARPSECGRRSPPLARSPRASRIASCRRLADAHAVFRRRVVSLVAAHAESQLRAGGQLVARQIRVIEPDADVAHVLMAATLVGNEAPLDFPRAGHFDAQRIAVRDAREWSIRPPRRTVRPRRHLLITFP